MQLFTIIFQEPVPFIISAILGGIIVLIVLRSAMSTEDRAKRGWVRRITGTNAKVLFGVLFVAWAVVTGITLTLVPHVGANSPYGGIALVSMFVGVFIMMGFIWAVIGE